MKKLLNPSLIRTKAGTLGSSSRKTTSAAETAFPEIRRSLIRWYRQNGRDLPWRNTSDPYRIWVSEILLQQTRVETVIPYYKTFLDRFPTVQSLAMASQDDVLKTWENLGYYSRARNLHRAARIVQENLSGEIPRSRDALRKLPGVGAYTAGAIASIAFGEPVPAVDGNARRVLARLFSVRTALNRPSTIRRLETIAGRLVLGSDPGAFNQGLMDLAGAFCTPRKPACSRCPLQKHCRSLRQGLQETIPAKVEKKKTPDRQAAAAFLRDRKNRLLVVRRPEKGLLCGLWKLPGGFLHEGEPLENGLVRTVEEEIGVTIDPRRLIGTVRHSYTHFRLILRVFDARIVPRKPRPLLCGDLRWADPDALRSLAFSRADRMALELAGTPHSTF